MALGASQATCRLAGCSRHVRQIPQALPEVATGRTCPRSCKGQRASLPQQEMSRENVPLPRARVSNSEVGLKLIKQLFGEVFQ